MTSRHRTNERFSNVRAEWQCSPEERRRREFQERVAGRSAVHRPLAAVCDLDAGAGAGAAHRVCALLRGVQRGLPQVAASQAVPALAGRQRRDAAALEQRGRAAGAQPTHVREHCAHLVEPVHLVERRRPARRGVPAAAREPRRPGGRGRGTGAGALHGALAAEERTRQLSQ